MQLTVAKIRQPVRSYYARVEEDFAKVDDAWVCHYSSNNIIHIPLYNAIIRSKSNHQLQRTDYYVIRIKEEIFV